MEQVNYIYFTDEKKEKKKKRRKRMLIILGILCPIILVLVAAVFVISNINVKAMNRNVDSVMDELRKNYTLTPLDAGEYEEIKLYGIMKFQVEQYTIEELGNLSVMRINMGVMQMSSIVITPKDKNLPLMSADYIYLLTNRKAYLEFYDLVKEKDDTFHTLLSNLSDIQKKYDYLNNLEISPTWYEHLLSVASYKACSFNSDKDIEAMLMNSLEAYIQHDKQLPLLSEEEKQEKLTLTVNYTDGLITYGGISTDVFKNALGPEVTKDFFDSVFFGTGVK